MNVQELSPPVLAYVGDAVYELEVRERLVKSGLARVNDLHKKAVLRVRASGQAACLERLMDRLDEEEKDLVRRGRNAHSGGVPAGASVEDYRSSTALEALLGWLYLQGRSARVREIMDLVWSMEVP